MGKYSVQAGTYSNNASSIAEVLNGISTTIDNIKGILSPSDDFLIATTIKMGENIKNDIKNIISKQNSISNSLNNEAYRLDKLLEQESSNTNDNNLDSSWEDR